MSRYAGAHANPQGAGDARPTALQIVQDEGREMTMKDKVIMITGCSSGIGVETARALAATGASLFLLARDVPKTQRACASFLGNGRTTIIPCDTSSLASVRAAAARFLSRSSPRRPLLHVLICNAAIMLTPSREVSADGHELQLATNYLGHWALFAELRDAMLAASTPQFNARLVNVSSSGHHAGEIDFDDVELAAEGAYRPGRAYGQSKLAQIYMSNYVDRVYGPRGLHALSLMPGGIMTQLQQHIPQSVKDGWFENPQIVAGMKSPEQGAATTVLAAVGREWEGKGGKYLEDCRVAGFEPLVDGAYGVKNYAYDEEKENRLWDLTTKMLL